MCTCRRTTRLTGLIRFLVIFKDSGLTGMIRSGGDVSLHYWPFLDIGGWRACPTRPKGGGGGGVTLSVAVAESVTEAEAKRGSYATGNEAASV